MTSSGANGDALTASVLEDALASFSRAVDVPYDKGKGGADPLTRGQLAQLLTEYAEPLM
jgi:hypothetical protein